MSKKNLKLKRCPFCGSKAKLMNMDLTGIINKDEWLIWGVFCKRDLKAEYAHGHYIDNYATPEEAVADWNRSKRGGRKEP